MSRPDHVFRKPKREKKKEEDEESNTGKVEIMELLSEQQNQNPRPRLLVNSQIVMDSTIPFLEEVIGYLKVFKVCFFSRFSFFNSSFSGKTRR